MRESRIEQVLVREVRKRGGKCLKWVSPGNRGVPDRIVLMPGGWSCFVETKAPGKGLRPLQEKMIRDLRGLGHRAFELDSLERVEQFCCQVLDKAGDAK